ncbi:pyridoxal-phosphate dependent enzyme [Candidatus Micrarchaeota archaeon]|nr:pyridoxal-phosphate dependent enzyme [Candidatus Micrarchaeota archaeon]
MDAHESILESVGDTPLVRLGKLSAGFAATVLAKVEYLNPGGSVKDRMAIKMIRDAESNGLLKPGGSIVEPTSGNTGAGLAMAAAVLGYHAVFVVPDKVSKEKIDLLKAYGADVVITPTNVDRFDSRSYYKVAERIAEQTGAYRPNQYFNPANPQAHYESTGPEIWRQTRGKITHFVAGMGTGGTISGIARYLKEQNPRVQVIGADPEGSIYAKPNGPLHQYKVEGIGEDFYPGTMDLSLVDRIVTTTDLQAFTAARRLAREEGILVGGSSGSATFAALEVARGLDDSAVVVALLPDGGRGYLSKMYSDEWMRQNGFLEPAQAVNAESKQSAVHVEENKKEAASLPAFESASRGVPNAF